MVRTKSVTAMGAIVVAVTTLTAAGDTTKEAQSNVKGLGVVLSVSHEQPAVRVGDRLKVSVRFSNSSDKPVPVCRWKSSGIETRIRLSSIPGGTDGGVPDAGFGGRFGTSVGLGHIPMLEPGKTLPADDREYTPMVPGRVTLTAHFRAVVGVEKTTIVTDPDGRRRFVFETVDKIDSGRLFAIIEFDVSAEMSPEMKQRYDKAGARIRDGSLPVQDRVSSLKDIAKEKHYFAARFVGGVWREPKEPALKAAALAELAALLEFGTAYEFLPDMLAVLRDENAALDVRQTILKFVARFHVSKDVRGVWIAEQAFYIPPPAVVTDLITTLKSVASGKDPFLSGAAKEILGRTQLGP
jgi:hypothetical protein